jgi:hypothetical protein
MKTALCVLLLSATAPLTLLADTDTAYQVLRAVGTQRGQDVLKHVIEVEGHAGVPQPTVWRVVLDDPAARGGVRELDISHGKIVAEHTPTRTYSGSSAGAIIDFHKLNLDSSGAFTVAEKEAQKARIGFDSVDYTLRTGDGADASPVWVIHMMDSAHHSIGTMSVAADTGAIVSSDMSGHPQIDVVSAGSPPPADTTTQEVDHDNIYTPTDEPPPVRQQDDTDTEDTHGLRVGHRIKTAILSAGQSLKNFITGHDSSNQ